MSWRPIEHTTTSRTAAPAVTIGIVRQPGPRDDPAAAPTLLAVTVRPAAVQGGLPWWRAGSGVSLAVGEGPHAGWLRLAPGAPHRLTRRGGPGPETVTARLPVPPGVDAAPQAPAAADYRIGTSGLEVRLPARTESKKRRKQ